MSFLNQITNFVSSVASKFSPARGDAEAAIRALAMVAAADGELDDDEAVHAVHYIESFDWISTYGSNEECEELFMEVVTKICDAKTPVIARMSMQGEAKKMANLVRKGSDNAKNIYDLCVEMASADGKVHPDEQKVLGILKTNLGA